MLVQGFGDWDKWSRSRRPKVEEKEVPLNIHVTFEITTKQNVIDNHNWGPLQQGMGDRHWTQYAQELWMIVI
jgi:hypothetical protein